VLFPGREDDVFELDDRQLPARWRAADEDMQAFALDAHALGRRLFLGGEAARRKPSVVLAPVCVERRRPAFEPDDRDGFGLRVAARARLRDREAVLLQVLDGVRERALGRAICRAISALRAAARGEQEQEDARPRARRYS
jgi:hypothetical protein